MKSIIFMLLLFLFIHAETVSKINEIPNGFRVVREVEGDLTEDGINDVARVIDKPNSDGNSETRRLQVYEGQSDGAYKLIIDNDKAIWGSDDGGQMGDPFCDLSYKRNSLYISYYGGSGWRWGVTFQFLMRGGKISLVGEESESFHISTEEKKTTSINYLTGKTLIRERKFNEQTRKLEPWVEWWEKAGGKPLIALADFDIDVHH